MLHPLLHHMRANQKGLGVVAVSPRYAIRHVCMHLLVIGWLLAASQWSLASLLACVAGRQAWYPPRPSPSPYDAPPSLRFHPFHLPIYPSPCRSRNKFSVFWQLPHGAVCGVLNGMEGKGGIRPALTSSSASAEVEAFFASKAAAKLAFQAAKGLEVGGWVGGWVGLS